METKKDEVPPAPLTQDLRNTLKAMMQQELEQLPELLEGLEPKERLNILCKLLPYVFPRIEAVPQVKGEPWQLL